MSTFLDSGWLISGGDSGGGIWPGGQQNRGAVDGATEDWQATKCTCGLARKENARKLQVLRHPFCKLTIRPMYLYTSVPAAQAHWMGYEVRSTL